VDRTAGSVRRSGSPDSGLFHQPNPRSSPLVTDTRFGIGTDSTEAMHQGFVEVGRRWSELAPWQTLAGWGAFLGGIGVLLWGIGSISHNQMKVYRATREMNNGALAQTANRSLLSRAQELVGR
jgi:hypothetical protein